MYGSLFFAVWRFTCCADAPADNGVNLSAVGASIISEVRYVVAKCTGTKVSAVNVFIDSMMID